MHLDEIVAWIDRAFGESRVLADKADMTDDLDSLRAILGGEHYQRYLRDEVNRQIIRDYLTNAVVLGVITEGGLAAFANHMETEDSRAVLALYMLMSAVEDAAELPPVKGEETVLQPLDASPEDPPHITLVPN